ncbi:MAG TPA: isocitrate lyase/phosphoenolpyruvate mutase family protein [Acidisphaera sp.]|nr:isocitrate lyase/phosphoenolpyruvate mutase family protein [Acidisphaera sp.]
MTQDPRRAAFRALHETGCFVLPNPWDIGSAKRLQRHGFKALASTSAGMAWTLGRQDYGVTLEDVLTHLSMLCAATDLPVNADFEAGFSDTPEGVEANVAWAAATGIAGISIEDRAGDALYDLPRAVERISAARAALDRDAPDVLLVGRSEGFLLGDTDLDATIARLIAYSQAGADCLYAPGVRDLGQIRAIVAAVAPKPVNVLLTGPEMRVADLAAAGVRRVSTGGALAAAAWAGFEEAVTMLLEEGHLPPRRRPPA